MGTAKDYRYIGIGWGGTKRKMGSHTGQKEEDIMSFIHTPGILDQNTPEIK